MNLHRRAELHAALADPHRVAIVDALALGDLTPLELARIAGIAGNLAAHHTGRLERAGLVVRRRSDGDGRRRYVTLRRDVLDDLVPSRRVASGSVLFLCTGNSARSPFAAALWRLMTGLPSESAGWRPAKCVHPRAVRVGLRFGVDLAGIRPRGYDDVHVAPALVVTVCDHAREAAVPFDAPILHWSLPDPAHDGGLAAFVAVFTDISERVAALASRRSPIKEPRP